MVEQIRNLELDRKAKEKTIAELTSYVTQNSKAILDSKLEESEKKLVLRELSEELPFFRCVFSTGQ